MRLQSPSLSAVSAGWSTVLVHWGATSVSIRRQCWLVHCPGPLGNHLSIYPLSVLVGPLSWSTGEAPPGQSAVSAGWSTVDVLVHWGGTSVSIRRQCWLVHCPGPLGNHLSIYPLSVLVGPLSWSTGEPPPGLSAI